MRMLRGEFVNGSAIVYKKRKGELIPGLQFEDGTINWLPYNWMGQFFCDRALVQFQRFFGYIDRTGKLITPLMFMIADDFAEDRAFATEGLNTILIDTDGKVIREYDEPFVTQDFRNGQAVLSRMTDPETMEDVLIDLNGEFITEFSAPGTLRTIDDLESGTVQPRSHWFEGLHYTEQLPDIRIIRDTEGNELKGCNHFLVF